jgi:hypothetical protein
VEANPEPVNLSELTFDGFSSYDVRIHLKELFRRGYISGEVNKYLASTDYIADFLTPAGSAYLKELSTSGLKKFLYAAKRFVRDLLIQYFSSKLP